MKEVFTFFAVVLLTATLWAQSPEKMSYQAVIRNAAGELVKQQPVGMQVSILQGSADGILVFAETHEATSNENGLVSIEIGAGVVVNGSFAAIDWSAGPYFLKTETDPEGGFNYTISGTSQLLSVPYAMHAKTAESLSGELLENDPLFAGSVAAAITTADTARWNTTQDDESDPVFSEWDKSSGITINKSQISDLGEVVQTETDPVFEESAAANISQYNIYKWNQKLDSESDPVYKKSVAAGISNADTARWNQNLATETDPVYSGSQAFNITATDITNLGNLSGTNTGDQDLSALATKTALGDSTAQLRSEIPDVSSFLTTETDPSVPAGTQPGQMQYWNGTAWVTVAVTQNEGATLQMIGGVPTWTGGTTPSVTNPTTGVIWMDRNLGASQVATSSTDAASYGDLYQWGRGTDGHQIRTSGTTTTLSTADTPVDGNFIINNSSPYDWRSPQNDNLWQGVSGTNNPCPSGYRLPTEAEWETERTSWSSNNAAGAFASPLKLPVAGYRGSSIGSLGNVGSGGTYWSSTVSGTGARYLYFDSSSAYMYSGSRAFGISVRCIKD